MMPQFYAYVHARPNTTTAAGIFYVGKGTLRRAHATGDAARNPHHKNVVAKYGRRNILVGKMACSDEATALRLEVGLIKCLSRMGVRLANQTSGGEGFPGVSVSDETKARISAAKTGTRQTAETRAKMSESHRQRMSSPEAKAKMVAATMRRMASPEARKKLSDAAKAQWAKLRESTPAHKGRMIVVQPQPVMAPTTRKDDVGS